MSTDGFFEGFLNDYFAESEEHLTAAADALLALDRTAHDPAAQRAAIDDLFRYFHTLKAISAMVELRPAEQLAHHLENYLRAIRDGQVALSTAGSDVLIDGTRRLEHIINAHRTHHEQPPIGDLLSRIDNLVGAASVETPAPKAAATPMQLRWVCSFVPTRELLASGVGVDAIRKRLGELGTIVEASPEVLADGTIRFEFTVLTRGDFDLAAELYGLPITVERRGVTETDTPSLASAVSDASSAGPAHLVRVDLARLDRLMQNVGDLVITRARLTDSLNTVERRVSAVHWRPVQENLVALDRQLRTLREGIMRIRLVPVGEIFRRMPFVVRDLANEAGKKVLVDLHGQTTEIDKYLIERMLDPVVHLVRNAVSHGIEPPGVRVAKGKKPEGTITLSASTVGDIVAIEIGDDGQGVDMEAVAARAREAGLPVPAAVDSAALLDLLCSPGFSTKVETDRASGRGVGMAVVKNTIEQLSGTLVLETTPGEGTRFIIQLPVTLAITDALIGRVGGESFAVPQGSVREVIDIAAADIRQMEGNEIVAYRDGALPIVRLSRLFGIDSGARANFHVFVVGAGSSSLGLVVDRIVGQREIVVRTVADPLVRVEGISGATDLGDGRVVLILDPAMLARATRLRSARALGSAAEWGRLPA
jgi:two-component system, chemotaxis family, sensor kinase CheA